ncbi:MAG: hypothetical protein ACYC9M_09300 [Desulfobulbaceae bacterium]
MAQKSFVSAILSPPLYLPTLHFWAIHPLGAAIPGNNGMSIRLFSSPGMVKQMPCHILQIGQKNKRRMGHLA